jgi:hypothetical protein
MTPHRALNTALAVLGIAATLAILGPWLDASPDRRGEHIAADQLDTALQAERRAALQERAARELCVKTHGVNAGHRWTDAGELVCTTKRNTRPVTVVTAARDSGSVR